MKRLMTLTAFLVIQALSSTATIYVPDNYAAIQDAIAAAVNGDEIIVRPGTYLENIDFEGKAITVKSELGPDLTTIYGMTKYQSVVNFEMGEGLDSILDGFLIVNGQDSGVRCDRSSPTIQNNVIYRCQRGSFHSGGGISCIDSNAMISKTIITRCESGWQGGGIKCENSAVTISGCVIYENRVSSGGLNSQGGGIYCHDSDVIISNNLIYRNLCWAQCDPLDWTSAVGGGITIYESSTSRIVNNTISHNKLRIGTCISSTTTGGGIYCVDADVTIDGNDIFYNSTDETYSGEHYGGGIYCKNYSGTHSPIIMNNRIYNNFAEYGGVIYVEQCSPIITGNSIFSNSADEGGGIRANIYDPQFTVTISGNVIYRNTSDEGGGINCTGLNHVIINNAIFQNASTEGGGGIWCYGPRPVITNNSIYKNSAGRGGGIWCREHNWDDPAVITNTILRDNSAPTDAEIAVFGNDLDPIVTYCNVTGGWVGTGNIDAAPKWADPAGGDFHLNWDSPCKDAGDSSAPELPSADAEGDPRFAGAGVDMGADEFYPHLYCRGDVLPGETVNFHVVGEPAQTVKVALGAEVVDPPIPTPHGDLFIWPIIASWPVGKIPGSGIRILPATVPLGWSPGEEYPFQAQVGVWGNPDTVLTNLLVLDVE